MLLFCMEFVPRYLFSYKVGNVYCVDVLTFSLFSFARALHRGFGVAPLHKFLSQDIYFHTKLVMFIVWASMPKWLAAQQKSGKRCS